MNEISVTAFSPAIHKSSGFKITDQLSDLSRHRLSSLYHVAGTLTFVDGGYTAKVLGTHTATILAITSAMPVNHSLRDATEAAAPSA